MTNKKKIKVETCLNLVKQYVSKPSMISAAVA